MAEESLYKVYSNWLFDGDLKREIPKELLKYNSPITIYYALSMFILNEKFTLYLDEYFNNMGLYYLEKEEVFNFLKKGVKDLRIQRNSIPFIPYSKKEKLYDALRKKIPVLKNYDIDLLSDIINDLENKDSIYDSLGLVKMEKPKKVKKVKQKKEEKIVIENYLKNIYQVAEIKK